MYEEKTVDFIKTVRDIYLNLNKNYSHYLSLSMAEQENILLNDVFGENVLNDYLASVDELNHISAKHVDDGNKKESVVFTENFDFKLSDQKEYGTKLLTDSICETIDSIKKEKGKVAILSLGIGDGSTAQKYSVKLDKNDVFIGCDIHDKYLSEAQKSNLNLETMKFDLNAICSNNNIPLPDQSFDIIECCSVCHHIEDFQSLVKEICRLLKPGGYFFFFDIIDKTADLSETMTFSDDHTYPSFHGIEFFRSVSAIKGCLEKLFVLRRYQRIGPGLAFIKAQKSNREI